MPAPTHTDYKRSQNSFSTSLLLSYPSESFQSSHSVISHSKMLTAQRIWPPPNLLSGVLYSWHPLRRHASTISVSLVQFSLLSDYCSHPSVYVSEESYLYPRYTTYLLPLQ